MKMYFGLFILSLFLGVFVNAQPIDWKFSSVKQSNGQYIITAKAVISPQWHIYAQTSHVDGPTPTKITFNPNPLIKFEGVVKEKGKKIKHFEEVFDFDVEYFENSVEYVQVISLNTNLKVKTNITGTIEYMLCTNGRCLSHTKEKFSIELY